MRELAIDLWRSGLIRKVGEVVWEEPAGYRLVWLLKDNVACCMLVYVFSALHFLSETLPIKICYLVALVGVAPLGVVQCISLPVCFPIGICPDFRA